MAAMWKAVVGKIIFLNSNGWFLSPAVIQKAIFLRSQRPQCADCEQMQTSSQLQIQNCRHPYNISTLWFIYEC